MFSIISAVLIILELLNPLVASAVFAQGTSSASCRAIGVNSAAYFAQGSSFYDDVKELNMGWTIEIGRSGSEQAVIRGINEALSRGLRPIVRIGVGSDDGGFFKPEDYVNFLNNVASGAAGSFYAVAGPNEPDSERWLDPRPEGQKYNPGDEFPTSARRYEDIKFAGTLLARYMNHLVDAKAEGRISSKVNLLSPTINISSWTGEPFIQAMVDAGAKLESLAGFSATSYSFSAGPSSDVDTQTAKVTKFVSLPLILTEIGNTQHSISALASDVAKFKNGLNGVVGALLFNAFNTNPNWAQFALTDEELAEVLGPECAPTVKRRKTRRPTKLDIPCERVTNDEFHPLRPYPGSPCDPLIPRSIPAANSNTAIPTVTDSFQTQLDKDYQMRNSVAFSCGNSLTPNSAEEFDSASLAIPGGCQLQGNTMVCKIPQKFDLRIDLANTQIPILGNTQDEGLTDAEKMNEYLSWYLNGAVGPSEQLPDTNPDRLINYSGPLQKLIPFDLKKLVKEALQTGPVAKPAPEGQYHNYLVAENGLRLTAASFFSSLFKNIPFSSLEDTTGEVVITVARTTAANQQDEDVLKGSSGAEVPLKLIIKAKP